MKASLIFWFCAMALLAPGQRFVEEKEKNVFPLSEDSAQVNVLNKLSYSLRESDPDKAMEYSREAMQLSKKLNYQRGLAMALGNSGWVYYRKADFVKAMEDSYEALRISEKIGEKAEIARCLNNIGAVFYEQRQYAKSLEHFKRALNVGKEINDQKSIVRALNNISYVYHTSKLNLDSAWHYAEQGNIASLAIKDFYLTAFALRTKGDVFESRENLSEALRHYELALQLAKNSRNNAMMNSIQRRIANVYIQQGKLREAIQLLNHNITEASLHGFQEELDRSYKLLAEAYFKNGDNALAFTFLKKQNVLHDSLFNEMNMSRMASLQNSYDTDMKQAQIELLTKESALKQEEIMRQRVQLYALIGGGTLTFLFVIVLLMGFNNLKRSKRAVELQKEELAKKNKTIEDKSDELIRLNSTKDKLFSIIGHDFRSPIQNLKSLLELFSRQDLTQKEFEVYSRDLKHKIDSLYVNMNNLLNWSVMQLQGIQTKPSVIDVNVLAREVLDLYNEAYFKKEISLFNEIPEETCAVGDPDHIQLVLRNLLSNAIKFTPQGGRIRIYSRQRENEIEVSVEDSGVGIASRDFEKLFVKETLWTVKGTNNEKGLGLGLLLCKEFIEKNNGRLYVRSEVSRGTTFTFTLPFAEMPVDKVIEENYLVPHSHMP